MAKTAGVISHTSTGLRWAMVLFLVALLTCSTLVLTACSDSSKPASSSSAQNTSAKNEAVDADPETGIPQNGILTVASTFLNDPYETLSSTKKIGFTIDLLTLIGEKTGLDIEYLSQVKHVDEKRTISDGTTADVAKQVADGNAYLGASSIIAGELPPGVIATNPYLLVDYALVTRDDVSFDASEDLNTEAATIAIVAGDTQALQWVQQNLPLVAVAEYDNAIDAIVGMNSMKANAALVDEPVVKRYMKVREPHLTIAEIIPADKEYVFLVQEGNDELLTLINNALSEIESDGSYEELFQEWFSDAPRFGTSDVTRTIEAVEDSTGA